jgi:hypothetical protein
MQGAHIAKKGSSGMRKVVARFNFSFNLIGNWPQSLTGHIVNVMAHYKKNKARLR